jgi:hypothetical protein
VFQCFFTPDILEALVKMTSEFIESILPNLCRERDAAGTTLPQIIYFMGIPLMSGVTKSSRVNIEYFWCEGDTGLEFVKVCMSLRRLVLLLRCLGFDSVSSRIK